MPTCPTKPTEEEIELRYRYDMMRLRETSLWKRLALSEKLTHHLSELLVQCLCRDLGLSLGMPLTMRDPYYSRQRQAATGWGVLAPLGGVVYLRGVHRKNDGTLRFTLINDNRLHSGDVTWEELEAMLP